MTVAPEIAPLEFIEETAPLPSIDGAPLTRWIPVSPSVAQRWLLHCAYDRQRPLYESHVDFLADAIANDEFLSRPGHITFVRVGKQRFLVDGQHRLSAVVRSGLTVTLEICEWTADTLDDVHLIYAHIDQGRKRSITDVFRARGVFQDSRLSRTMVQRASSACGLIITGFETIKGYIPSRSLDVRTQVLSEWMPWAEQYAEFIAGTSEPLRRRLASSPVMAVGLVTTRYQEEKAATFWRRIAADDGLVQGEPEHTLARYLMVHPTNARGAVIYARVAASAWNAAFAGEKWGKVVVKEGARDRAIVIAGTPYNGKKVIPFERSNKR